MKAILAALLLGLLSYRAYATQDFILEWQRHNLHVECAISGSLYSQEYRAKVFLLVHLADSLIQRQGYGAQPVLLRVSSLRVRQPAYSLGYGQFAYRAEGAEDYSTRATGLQVLVRGHDFDLQAALRLLLYGLRHEPQLKAQLQERLQADQLRWNDRRIPFGYGPKLSQRLTRRLLHTPSATVAQLLRQRVFWKSRRNKLLDSLAYYYQHNAFHFFAHSPTAAVRGYQATAPTGPDVLVVDNVQELVGCAADGYFVITSDSSFYYLRPGMRGAVGPLPLPRPLSPYRGVDRYTYTRQPTRRFVLTLADNIHPTQELVFEPDQSAVARYLRLTPAAGFALLWLLLAGMGSLAAWREHHRVRAATRRG